MSDPSTLEAVLRRDRGMVLGALVAVILGCWLYLLAGAGMGSHSPAAAVMEPPVWSPGYALLILVMWWSMMLAMMLPAASPAILLFARVSRRAWARGAPYVATGTFVIGYALAWGSFSVAAVGAQWTLDRSGLFSSAMNVTSGLLGGGLLIAAGLYQLSPLKRRCLDRCRSPLRFFGHRWRRGRGGAIRMGLDHGAYCLGCCWVLMGLLFYGGVMSLYWISGLALYVLLEKTVPAGGRMGRGLGLLLVLWGGFVLLGAR